MGELESALDALASEDLHAMGAGEQLDRTALLIRARNRIDAELARGVRVADLTQAPEHDGLKTMRSWLRTHARLSAASASQLIRVGRALELLPAVGAAFADGQMTAEQVTAVAPITTEERRSAAAEQGVDLGEVDRALAEVAVSRPHAQLGRVVHHYLARLDPDGVEPDPTEGRSLTLSKLLDGWLSFRGELDAVGGEKVQAMLESFVQADRPKGDLRTRAQQLGDAFVQAADVALASGKLPILRTVKPHVIAMINIDHLADPATGLGAAGMGFGAVISAARARWLACDGTLSRIVMGPEGQVLDHGRSKRIVPPGLRRAVEGAGPALRVRRLRGPDSLVRCPSCAGVAASRGRDQPRELSPPVRTAPHEGAPRIPGRATTRRPMAHLPARQHRDRPRHTADRLS